MADQLVCLKGGVTVPASDLRRLLDIEGRGIRLSMRDDGKVSVSPAANLTGGDRAFLMEHHALVLYCLTASYNDDRAVTT